MNNPKDTIMSNSVVQNLPGKENENKEDKFNEVELTQAMVELNNDHTIVVRMHSFDTNTAELLYMAKETLEKMIQDAKR